VLRETEVPIITKHSIYLLGTAGNGIGTNARIGSFTDMSYLQIVIHYKTRIRYSKSILWQCLISPFPDEPIKYRLLATMQV